MGLRARRQDNLSSSLYRSGGLGAPFRTHFHISYSVCGRGGANRVPAVIRAGGDVQVTTTMGPPKPLFHRALARPVRVARAKGVNTLAPQGVSTLPISTATSWEYKQAGLPRPHSRPHPPSLSPYTLTHYTYTPLTHTYTLTNALTTCTVIPTLPAVTTAKWLDDSYT